MSAKNGKHKVKPIYVVECQCIISKIMGVLDCS